MPTITEVTPQTIYCPRECIFAPLVVRGSGFYPGGTVQFNDDPPVVFPDGIAFDQVSFALGFDTRTYNPGFNRIVISSPADNHGGGTSNAGWFAFLGQENTLAVDGEAFLLDQAGKFTKPDGTITIGGKITVFDVATGNKLREFPAGALVTDVAIDNLTGYVVLAQGKLVYVRDRSGEIVSGANPENLVISVGARAGRVCLSEDDADLLASFEITALPQLVSTAIGDFPLNVAMTELPNDGLVCSVFNVGDRVFSVVKIPEMQLLRFSKILGVTSVYDVVTAGRGGWQLAVLNSGPRAGVAALLAQADNLLVFVDLRTGQEVRRVNLEVGSNPFRIAADETNGKLVVALADAKTGTTRFIAVDPADGTVTNLEATAPFLATGLAVSADGAKLYAGNRGVFAILDNR